MPTYFITCLSTIFFILLSDYAEAADHPELKHFPVAHDDIKRMVITLPVQANEKDLKVELIPGKMIATDGVNHMRLQATIQAVILQGWGYTYYNIQTNDAVLSTMMASPNPQPSQQTFIQGNSEFIPYNSRLPIVVYAPQALKLHYRIWKAGKNLDAELGATGIMSMLAGSWVEPAPNMKDGYQGIRLYADGTAESINMPSMTYETWSADATHITLTGKSIDNHASSSHTLTYAYQLLENGHLSLQIRQTTYIYQRR